MQSPGDEGEKFVMKSRGNSLHSMIENLGTVWSQKRRLMLGATGALLGQGYPLKPIVQDGRVTCSFHRERPPACGGPRARLSMQGQAGNGMHVHQAGLIMTWALLHTTVPTNNPFSLALARLSAGRR